jgi:tetratricopeptide (TPR) repeat protein
LLLCNTAGRLSPGVVASSPAEGKRRRLPGLAVRPGAIRQARKEAGLSLGQVALGEISRTAVFLAETGKTRPTLPTIQLIAARTGKPVEYFLDLEGARGAGTRLDLDKLRELAAAEKFDELLAFAGAAKSAAVDPMDRAWAGFYMARAQLWHAKPQMALRELAEARSAFEAAGDEWTVVECMDWQAAALHLLEDRSALTVAQDALEACRRLRPANRTLEARILGRLGSIHVAHHRWPKAVDYYTQAVEVAGELRDLSRLGKMYNDLGIAYEHLGDLARSRIYAQKAITVHELLNDRLSVARAENNLGLVLIRQGELDQAREHLNRSLSICEDAGVEVGKSHVLMSLAELDFSDHDPDGARRRLEKALELAEKNHEHSSVAQAHEQLGQVAESIGDEAAADGHYATAIRILENAGHGDREVSCRAAYAQILENRGDTQGALDQLKRAVAAARPDLAQPSAADGAADVIA